MQLPHVLDRRTMQHFEHCPLSALARSIVHHDDTRLEGGKCRGFRGISTAMMRGEVGVHKSKEIPWTNELEERLASQIADVEEPELPVADEDAGRARVLVRIYWRNRLRRTGGVHPTCARKRCGERRVGRADYCDVDVA